MFDVTSQSHPDPLVDKISRTISGQYVAFKRKRMKCDIHAIYDENAGFLYAPIQKVACSSIKSSLVEHFCAMQNGGALRPKHKFVHKYFASQPKFWITLDALEKCKLFKFCVVRDPVDRFVSGYRNRIFDNEDLIAGQTRKTPEGELPNFPDIEFFATHLGEYCAANARIDWHFRPQLQIIVEPTAFDRVYDISEIENLYADLKDKCGVSLTLQNQNASRTPEPTQLSPTAKKAVMDFYGGDYDAFAGIIRPKN